MAMPEETTLEHELDQIFAAIGNAEIVVAEGSRPIVADWTPELEDQEPKATMPTATTGIRTGPHR
jgi:uncharacterized protein YqgV (UPF0045/DUF77 family)